MFMLMYSGADTLYLDSHFTQILVGQGGKLESEMVGGGGGEGGSN